MKRIILLLSIIATVVTLPACQEGQQDTAGTTRNEVDSTPSTPVEEPRAANTKALKYSVYDKVKSETGNKAQVLLYAFLEEDADTETELENTLKDLYEQNKDEGGYQNFDKPTVVGVYLFTSEKLGRQDKSAWLGMLMKGPSDTEPRININSMKLKSQSALKDNETSEDERQLAALNKTLAKQGLELCSFSKLLGDIELECIHEADKKYPNYGMEHVDYVDKLNAVERNKLRKKYHLSADVFTKVNVFANVYCK